MRIAINCSTMPTTHQGGGGGLAYILRLVRDLASRAEVTCLLSPNNQAEFRSFLGEDTPARIGVVMDGGPAEMESYAHKADLFYSPANGLHPILMPRCVPIVTCLLDLLHVHRPHLMTRAILEARHSAYGLSASRSNAVITISAFEENNIRSVYGKGDVKGIHLTGFIGEDYADRIGAISLSENVARRIPWRHTERYLVYPAVPWPHKNHWTLLNAFRLLRSQRNDVHLVLTGATEHVMIRRDIRRMIATLDIDDAVSVLGHVSDSDMAWLIAHALGLVFPSDYEGFGVPVIDAMKLGTPVVCSTAGSLPEIAGAAATYFTDHRDPKTMANEIAAFVADEPGRLDLTRRGLARAEQFSSALTAERTLTYFKSVAESAGNRFDAKQFVPIDAQCALNRVTVVVDGISSVEPLVARSSLDTLERCRSHAAIVVMAGAAAAEAIAADKPRDLSVVFAPADNAMTRDELYTFVGTDVVKTDYVACMRIEEITPAMLSAAFTAVAAMQQDRSLGSVALSRSAAATRCAPLHGETLREAYNQASADISSFFTRRVMHAPIGTERTFGSRAAIHAALSETHSLVLPVD